MRAEPPDRQAKHQKRAAPGQAQERGTQQVQVRLVGQTREAVEAALTRLQSVGVQAQVPPRKGRKGDWLVYATLTPPTEGQQYWANDGEV